MKILNFEFIIQDTSIFILEPWNFGTLEQWNPGTRHQPSAGGGIFCEDFTPRIDSSKEDNQILKRSV